MNLGPCDSPTQAVEALKHLRMYKPFQYSGTWFVSTCNGIGVAFRSNTSLVKRIQRDEPGRTTIESFRLSIA